VIFVLLSCHGSIIIDFSFFLFTYDQDHVEEQRKRAEADRVQRERDEFLRRQDEATAAEEFVFGGRRSRSRSPPQGGRGRR
jgi:hypothetical protein